MHILVLLSYTTHTTQRDAAVQCGARLTLLRQTLLHDNPTQNRRGGDGDGGGGEGGGGGGGGGEGGGGDGDGDGGDAVAEAAVLDNSRPPHPWAVDEMFTAS